MYECETWSLTLREERGLRVCENKGLRIIFLPKRDEETSEWRKLHNVLYSSSNNVRVIKSRRIIWAGHLLHMWERRGVRVRYRVLVEKPEERDQLGDPGVDGKIILRWIFRKWDVEVRTESSWLMIGTGGGHLWMRQWTFGFHKYGEFLDQL